jgi:3'(2'), 5'-bisphosphate nucleotidase
MTSPDFVLDTAAREGLLDIARRAGAAILEVYARDFEVEAKADRSPLTEADLAAHALIRDGLAALAANVPLLSEESAPEDLTERRSWQRYWLVDPLDGTREFVKRNGEFTVNIALIEEGRTVFGVVYAPVLEALYWAQAGQGSWLRSAADEDIQLSVQRPAPRPLRVAVSRSHLDPRSAAMIQHLQQPLQVPLGSSLKFCRLAEGQVDLYPRFGPTGEWDTAAGQCVLEEAGGAVLGLDGQPLRYNQREGLINPDFIALGDVELPWREWL